MVNFGSLLIPIGKPTYLATAPVLVGDCLALWVLLSALLWAGRQAGHAGVAGPSLYGPGPLLGMHGAVGLVI